MAPGDKGMSEALARRFDEAWESRKPISPPSESEGLKSVEEAYAVQTAWSELRLGKDEEIVGRKIGLTSKAMQEQLGVNEPDYGSLWASRRFDAREGRAEMPSEVFLQPRLEGEIAFLIGRPLGGKEVTAREVLEATDALAVAVEVVDSRVEDWRIKLADTVADNASYGGFTVGTWSRELKDRDLRPLRMRITKSGETVVEGLGEAALGNPATAVAWLANRLSGFGVALRPGDVVLSGALGKAVPVQGGDELTVELEGQAPLTVAFV